MGMDKKTKMTLNDFVRSAQQRLRAKKIPKYQTLHIPSMDTDIKIRNLSFDEIAECQNIEEPKGSNRADKYCIYLAVCEPDLKEAAKAIMAEERELPVEERQLKEALDIVDIFEMTEVTEIAMAIMRLSGVISSKKVTVVEGLKNS